MKLEYEMNDVHKITLLDVPVVEVGLNSGWWIYSVEYDGKVPPNEIEEVTVTFKKTPKWIESDSILGCPHCGYGWPREQYRPKYCPECGTRLT